MKLFVLLIGLVCLGLSVLFIVHGTKYGLVKKEILTNHYTKTEIGKKAVYTGIFHILIGVFFLIGSIIILASLYVKIKQGII